MSRKLASARLGLESLETRDTPAILVAAYSGIEGNGAGVGFNLDSPAAAWAGGRSAPLFSGMPAQTAGSVMQMMLLFQIDAAREARADRAEAMQAAKDNSASAAPADQAFLVPDASEARPISLAEWSPDGSALSRLWR